MISFDRCVICGAGELREVRAAEISRIEEVAFNYSFSPANNRTFRVVRCRSCGHEFCSPIPAGMAEEYEDVVDTEYLKHERSRRLAADEVVRLIRRHGASGTLLDIGCATGDFLTAARDQGFAVEGIELSRWSRDIARSRGLLIHDETIAARADAAPGGYDVVSLIGVIEHFIDPKAEMERIARLLRPGGLVVIWTGDVASPESRILGHHWWYWQGQHIQYFTHRSLRKVAADAGLDHVTTSRFPWVATLETVSNSLRRYPMHAVLAGMASLLFKIKPVIYLRLPGELLLLARKPR